MTPRISSPHEHRTPTTSDGGGSAHSLRAGGGGDTLTPADASASIASPLLEVPPAAVASPALPQLPQEIVNKIMDEAEQMRLAPVHAAVHQQINGKWAFYSHAQAVRVGGYDVYRTPSGRTVHVTEVRDEPTLWRHNNVDQYTRRVGPVTGYGNPMVESQVDDYGRSASQERPKRVGPVTGS